MDYINETIPEEIRLFGLSLKRKTTNLNGQSASDCGNLWQEFETNSCAARITGKTGDEVFAVYHAYEGDHTMPFSYFIGCRVPLDTKAQEGFDVLTLPKGSYKKWPARGKMPDCIAEAWMQIWAADIPRAYHTDFEVYDQRSKDWSNAEVDIFISLKQ
jgi:predicted transcriptional regulator YdeE